jgi:hypothetical protein
MKRSILVALLTACGTVAGAADDSVARLRSAHSLHCTFTANTVTKVINGHRTVEQNYDKGSAIFVNIDLAKGTARVIAKDLGGGYANLSASWEQFGSLWLVERSPSGNVIATTIYPMYAEGTHDFIALEARHTRAGMTIIGQEIYGTCKIVE